MGRTADRHGQRPVLLVSALVNALALTTLAFRPDAGRAELLALCALIGLSMPQVGGMARARWLALSRRHAGTAMAYEGTADELAYVIGPALAGLLAAAGGPAAALLAAATAGILAVGAFALHPTHTATDRRQEHETGTTTRILDDTGTLVRQSAGNRIGAALVVPALAMVLMGAFFAATQTAITAFVTGADRPSSGGLIYALMAIGSAGTALATAAIPARYGPRSRCAVPAAGLVIGVLLMTTAGTVPMLCAAVLFTGLSVGPIMVTLNQVAGALAPVGRTATTMAYLGAGSVVGVALGATGSGALADAGGSLGAFAVAAAASAALLLLALLGLPKAEGRSSAE